ncbi:MAG: extracellular solute-binding protein [Verrucomicrobiales bacterium]|nr:extracellular solute-binding protein [Verrucomicrobiales bacterium]
MILFQRLFLIGLLGFISTQADAQSYPGEDWTESPSPLASEFAEPGGKISMYAAQFPKSFNYQIENNVFAREIFRLMFEQLLKTDSVTLENRPGLANQWEISEDKKQFTFHIDPDAKWSDGKPITADDVVWSFEAVKNPNHLSGSLQAVMKRLNKIEKLDERTVVIHADEVHWRNLLACSTFYVLPMHWWKDQDFNKVNFEFPVVSGPYALGEVKESVFARVEKREDYWKADSVTMEGLFNFDTIEYRFYAQRDIAYEAFKKGEFDLFAVYTSSRWIKETEGDRFDKNWIVKQSVYNHQPVGFQGYAMNMRRAPYDDRRVRRALAHLVDRERMNRTLMFNQYPLSSSYWPDLWDEKHPNPNEFIGFDLEKARTLLKEAGWEVNGSTGKLEKDGKPFVINFLSRDPSWVKFLLIFEEALNDVGIELKIDQKDWAAWARDMEEFNFDMTIAPWSAIPFKDAEPMWHSDSADLKSSNNITGFKNDKVDELVASTRDLFEVEARHEVIREIDQIIYEETPYILLWHMNYVRLLYWNKFGMPDHVLGKYTEEWASVDYWWNDEFMAEDLEVAKENGDALPPPPREVNFDNVFVPGVAESMLPAPIQ